MAKKRPKKTAHRQPRNIRRNPCRALVTLDQEPIKRDALEKCRLAMNRLEEARSEWIRYENEDRPAFERWYRDRLGELTAKVEREESIVRQHAELIEEVEFEYHYRGGSHRAAYRRVMADREHRDREDGDADDADEDFDFDEDDDEDDAFDAFFRDVFGCEDDEAEEMFREFTGRTGGTANDHATARKAASSARSLEEGSRLTRLKDRFRLLARKLHPDVQGEITARKNELWHEAQEAYQEGNLEHLDTLLALCEVEEDRVTEATGITLLEKVGRKFRDSLKEVRRRLREARRDPAWRFSRVRDRGKIEARLRRDLELALDHARGQREEMESLIGEWKKPAGLGRASAEAKRRKTPRKRTQNDARTAGLGQTEFTFG